jgi:aldehyde:ferredoxin oxidoreductase
MHGNLGGKWGSALKSAGYDALAVQGKAESPVYLYIHDGGMEFRDASVLWGKTTFETAGLIRSELGKSVSVLCVGPAAENQVSFATALADRGASVSSGLGSVFGSKNLKAIVVSGNRRVKAARPEQLGQIVEYIRPIRAGTFDAPSPWAVEGVTRKEPCYGCGLGCTRQSYGDKELSYKSFCQAGVFYLAQVMNFYGKRNEVSSRATQLCDAYGLDTIVMSPLILWLGECYREGLISERSSGLPLSKIGSLEFIETLTRIIAGAKDLEISWPRVPLKLPQFWGELPPN